MAERTTKAEKGLGYLDELREIQDQYRELSDLHEKQKVYAEQLSEIVRALQREADATIPLRPSILGDQWSAAYLVSDAVVVMFDLHREMTSKPLSKFPPSVVVAVIEECASELGRQLAKKREAESEKVETLEKVLREISRAHPYRRAREEQPELEKVEPPTERVERSPQIPPMPVTEKHESPPPTVPEKRAVSQQSESRAPPVTEKREAPAPERKESRAPERKEPPVVEKRAEQPAKAEPVEVAPQMRSSSSFVFKGSYGQNKEEEASY